MAAVTSSGPIVVPTPYAACRRFSSRGRPDRPMAVFSPPSIIPAAAPSRIETRNTSHMPGASANPVAPSAAGAGQGEQHGHAEPAGQGADKGADHDRACRDDQEDQPQVGDRRPEALAHGWPAGAEHPIGQAQHDEAPQAQHVQAASGPHRHDDTRLHLPSYGFLGRGERPGYEAERRDQVRGRRTRRASRAISGGAPR